MLTPRYVDTRERERLSPLERAGFEPRQLLVGDVQFPEQGGGLVLVENKKVKSRKALGTRAVVPQQALLAWRLLARGR